MRNLLQDSDKRFIAISLVVAGILMIGVLMGALTSSYGYARAWEDGKIQICTTEQIDYQKAIIELQKCQANKQNFNLYNISRV